MRKPRRAYKEKEVTLTMEVCYPFQLDSAQEGYDKSLSLSDVMKETGTTIYMSAGCTYNGSIKSQRWAIQGHQSRVEKARQLIRGNIPVEFSVSCRADKVDTLGQQLLFAHFWNTFGVLTAFKLIPEDCSYAVYLRGHHDYIDRLKEAVHRFCHFTQTPSESVEVQVETSHEHVQLVLQHNELISRLSGARIRIPQDQEDECGKNVILIRGCMDAAYSANDLINGLTPLQLQFSVAATQVDRRIRSTAKEMGVLLTSRQAGSNKLEITLSTYEWNAQSLNELMRMCLNERGRPVMPRLPKSWQDLVETRSSFLSTACLMKWERAGTEIGRPLSPEESGGSLPEQSSQSLEEETLDTDDLCRMSDDTIPDPMSPVSPDLDSTLSEDEMRTLLSANNLSHFSILFQEKGVDAKKFSRMTEQDLIALGVSSKQARRTMLSAITNML